MDDIRAPPIGHIGFENPENNHLQLSLIIFLFQNRNKMLEKFRDSLFSEWDLPMQKSLVF